MSDCVINPLSLNKNQMMVFNYIKSYYIILLKNPKYVDLLRLIVLGTASTGKFYLMKMIYDWLCKILKDYNVNISPIILLILTGVIVFNIYSLIIHSLFSISVSAKSFNLNNKSFKRL